MKRYIATLLLAVLLVFSCSDRSESEAALDTSFVHVVYFWLKDPDKGEDRKAFESAIAKLVRDSRYTKTNFLGTPPVATREVVDDSYTYCLIVSFASAADQEAYQVEEAHLAFIEEAGDLWSKVVVYDSQPADN